MRQAYVAAGSVSRAVAGAWPSSTRTCSTSATAEARAVSRWLANSDVTLAAYHRCPCLFGICGSPGANCATFSGVPEDDAQSPIADGPAPGAEADAPSPPAAEADRAPPSAAPPARLRVSGRLIFAAGATVIAVLVVILAARQAHRRAATTTDGTSRGSGAAIRAPEGPGLAGATDSGVRLTGFVVD